MWVNPKYARPTLAQASPPEPSGEVLAEFARLGRGRGPDGKLVVTLEEFNGHPFVSMRLWSKGRDGHYYPTAKGATLRMGEVEEAIEALERAAGISRGGKERRPIGAIDRGEYSARPLA